MACWQWPHLRSGIASSSEPGVPDGMKCDLFGNVWVCAPGGSGSMRRMGGISASCACLNSSAI